MSMSNISAFYEINDITFYKDIINPIEKVAGYEGEHKIAANMGVYLADMIYGIGAKNLAANESFEAVMQLSEKLGVEEQFTDLIIGRLNAENIDANEVSKNLDDALKSSGNKLSQTDRKEIYNYLLYGNYIEKLHLISSVLGRAKNSDLPASAKANLNRTLLILMAKQGNPLDELSRLMANQSSELVAHRDIQTLLALYKKLAVQKDAILKLEPAQIYNHETIKSIETQIDIVRARIVN